MRFAVLISHPLIRYPHDIFDRTWSPYNDKKVTQLTTSLVVNFDKNHQLPPSVVMSSAATPINLGTSHLNIYWEATILDSSIVSKEFYAYMYFVEVQKLKANQSRAFDVIFNGKLWSKNLVPDSSNVTTLSSVSPLISTNGIYNFTFVKLENSILPPIINAFEIFALVDFSQSETDQDDGMQLKFTFKGPSFPYFFYVLYASLCYLISTSSVAYI